ncbi:MAG: lipopolysaccharide transport system ATP-binding protein [Mycobacterium sp.]|nr:lipopolysaccharide transport system ATP-binding protein [Mycobacterium sp.]
MSSKPLPEGSVVANRIWKRFREDARAPQLKDRLRLPTAGPRADRWRWALKDIDFAIEPGQSVGLMGTNGSGKSTLLKVLTRVMAPHTGHVDIIGRVGALIEVRAGIHPELSGRENVYLYGSLLGLPRRVVAQRFDDIVGFAELSTAIDRQVKFYSTGMQMRLGFAVAAYLQPDVLLVDEVLAVGDAAFQQRCLDRMREVLQSGTTLVLVSHDLASLEAMCQRGLWLDNGVLRHDGPMRETLAAYRGAIEEYADLGYYPDGPVRLAKCTVSGPDGAMAKTDAPLDIAINVQSTENCPGRFFIGVSEGASTPIFVVSNFLTVEEGETNIAVRLERLPVARGRYSLWVGMVAASDRDLIPWHHTASFDVGGPVLEDAPQAVVRLSPVLVASDWTLDSQ